MQNISKKLADGIEIPVVALGTWKATGSKVREAVKAALAAGYRHIDTAKIYGNEREVGEAIRESGVPRSEIFVTTKLWNADQGYEKAFEAFEKSKAALGLDYIDLYIIHWPEPRTRQDSWRALEEIYAAGKCRAIGVSNYTIKHLKEMKTYAKVMPMVNQVEFHPFLYQKELLEYCASNNIALEAYSPLAHGERQKDKVITAIAQAHSKSNAQIMLRWSLQHGNIILPKSTNPERIGENLAVFDFELTGEEMARLDGLNEDFRTCWDPSELV
jgi:diketogulonate reductase-like aldo/keto reductase